MTTFRGLVEDFTQNPPWYYSGEPPDIDNLKIGGFIIRNGPNYWELMRIVSIQHINNVAIISMIVVDCNNAGVYVNAPVIVALVRGINYHGLFRYFESDPRRKMKFPVRSDIR